MYLLDLYKINKKRKNAGLQNKYRMKSVKRIVYSTLNGFLYNLKEKETLTK